MENLLPRDCLVRHDHSWKFLVILMMTYPYTAGYYKQNLESYMSDLEYSQVYTLEALVEFNRKHADKELPPRQ